MIVDPTTDAKALIPVFGVSTSNKCRPDEPAVARCEGTDLKLEIERDGVVPDAIMLKAGTSGADPVTDFLWEVQDAKPSIANGESVTVTFEPTEPVREAGAPDRRSPRRAAR